jgi:hypothetical protein
MDVVVVVGEETEPRDFDSGTVAGVNFLVPAMNPLEHEKCQSGRTGPSFWFAERRSVSRAADACLPDQVFFMDLSLWLKSC